jgi:biopolymer transport protein ExbD
MRLDTHSLLLQALANVSVDKKDSYYVSCIIDSKIQGEQVEQALREDPTGHKAARILLEAAANLAVAADKILETNRRK